jgi:hypothetical protein
LQFCPLFFIILYFKKFLWKCRSVIERKWKWKVIEVKWM